MSPFSTAAELFQQEKDVPEAQPASVEDFHTEGEESYVYSRQNIMDCAEAPLDAKVRFEIKTSERTLQSRLSNLSNRNNPFRE